MKIQRAIFVAGTSAFYFDDQKAIKNGAIQNGFSYSGKTQTNGFSAIRQEGECVSIILELTNGCLALGDCAAVQYSGAGGRDSLFKAEVFIPFMDTYLRPLLEGRDVSNFLENTKYFDELEIEGQRLHTAIRYGLSQALLDATAIAHNILKTEVICREYNLPILTAPISLFGQSGDDRYTAVDKMIIKRVDALPHGLINNIPDKLGNNGEKLKEYVGWLTNRVRHLRHDVSYHPDFHIDVYGTIGTIFDHEPDRIASYLAELGEITEDFPLYIEGPVDAGEKSRQIAELYAIKTRLKELGSSVKIVADEWCNTFQDIIEFADAGCCDTIQIKTPDLGSIHNIVEAILYCNKRNIEAYQGGTCNETDISARTCVHLALAARPMRMLIKPGMGMDEGLTIVSNEMHRSIAVLKAR